MFKQYKHSLDLDYNSNNIVCISRFAFTAEQFVATDLYRIIIIDEHDC